MPKYDNLLLANWLTDLTYFPLSAPASRFMHRNPGWTSINQHIARILMTG